MPVKIVYISPSFYNRSNPEYYVKGPQNVKFMNVFCCADFLIYGISVAEKYKMNHPYM